MILFADTHLLLTSFTDSCCQSKRAKPRDDILITRPSGKKLL